MRKELAIIVLNYNSSAECIKCISFIKVQQKIEAEVIIVDNCSNIEELNKIRSLCHEERITLLESQRNRGFSAGNNIGLRYAYKKGYEYILVMNPDVELHQENYLHNLLAKISSDKMIAVIGSDIINAEGIHQNPMRELSYWKELLWPLDLIKTKITRKTSYVCDYTTSCYCEKLSGCCFMIRTSFLLDIGFLDEETFLYCEEPILAKQVKSFRQKMYYMAEIQAKHQHIKNQKGDLKNRMSYLTESRTYYLKKHSGYKGLPLWLILKSRKLQFWIYKLWL